MRKINGSKRTILNQKEVKNGSKQCKERCCNPSGAPTATTATYKANYV